MIEAPALDPQLRSWASGFKLQPAIFKRRGHWGEGGVEQLTTWPEVWPIVLRCFDHEMTAKHANNCTPRVTRSVVIPCRALEEQMPRASTSRNNHGILAMITTSILLM